MRAWLQHCGLTEEWSAAESAKHQGNSHDQSVNMKEPRGGGGGWVSRSHILRDSERKADPRDQRSHARRNLCRGLREEKQGYTNVALTHADLNNREVIKLWVYTRRKKVQKLTRAVPFQKVLMCTVRVNKVQKCNFWEDITLMTALFLREMNGNHVIKMCHCVK